MDLADFLEKENLPEPSLTSDHEGCVDMSWKGIRIEVDEDTCFCLYSRSGRKALRMTKAKVFEGVRPGNEEWKSMTRMLETNLRAAGSIPPFRPSWQP